MTQQETSFPTPEQRKTLWQAITLAALFFLIAVGVSIVIGLISFLTFLSSVLVPLGIASIIVILLHPVVEFIAGRISLKRHIIIILLLIIVFLAGFIIMLAFVLGFLSLLSNLPDLVNNFNTVISQRLNENPELVDALQSGAEIVRERLPQIVSGAVNFLLSAVAGAVSLIGLVIGFIFIPLYCYYLLVNYERIKARWYNYIPLQESALRDEIELITGQIAEYIVTFFRGQVTIAIIIGAFISAGLWIFGLEYAVPVGIFAGFAGIIPYLGAVLAFIPGVTLAIIQSGGDWTYVLLIALVFAAGSQLESLVVSPKIMSNRTGLHPMVVIISMLAWGIILGGILGFILAVPLTATLKVLLNRYFWKLPEEDLPDTADDSEF